MKKKFNVWTGQYDYVGDGVTNQFVGNQIKQYSEAAGDFEVTGTGGWATTYAIITPYQTINGEWEADGVIAGDLTVAATSGYTLNISEILFKNITGFFQPCTCWIKDSVGAWRSDIKLCSALPNSGQIYLEAPDIKSIYVEFHASLEEKPTWAQEFPAINLSTNAFAVRDTYRKLVSFPEAESTVWVDADELILQNSLGLVYRASGISVHIDMTLSGAGGLDTGSEANSTWYHNWVIYNPTTDTLSGLFSLSPTNPTMPSGYTFKAYAGAVYNNASGNFNTFERENSEADIAPVVIGTNLNNTIYAARDISTVVPVTAKKVIGFVYGKATSDQDTDYVDITGISNGTGAKRYRVFATTATSVGHSTEFHCKLFTPQTFWSRQFSSSGGRNHDLTVTGYSF